MRRRDLILLLSGAITTARTLHAQQKLRLHIERQFVHALRDYDLPAKKCRTEIVIEERDLVHARLLQ